MPSSSGETYFSRISFDFKISKVTVSATNTTSACSALTSFSDRILETSSSVPDLKTTTSASG